MRPTESRRVNTRAEFRRGLTDIVGPSLGISAWGLVTGVAMIKTGLSVPLAVLMSLVERVLTGKDIGDVPATAGVPPSFPRHTPSLSIARAPRKLSA